jgi:hypothetical protein
MQTQDSKFTQRFGAAALAVAGLIAAATAHAEPAQDSSAAPSLDLREAPRQCTSADAFLARLQYPKGTTFLLTDAGLVVLEQPKAVSKAVAYPEPEPWPNSGG